MKRFKGVLRKRKGFTIVAILISLVVLAIFTFLGLSISTQNLAFIRKEVYSTKATYAAEAGISRAAAYLYDNPTWDGTTDNKLTFSSTQMPGTTATYTVRVYNNFAGTTDMNAPNGVTVSPGLAYLYSTGVAGPNPGKSTKYVGAMFKRNESFAFNYALFGDESVQITGGPHIDSYDSSLGPYGPSTVTPKEADVATNSNNQGDFDLKGPATIDGTAIVGPESPGISQNGPGGVTNGVSNLPAQVPFPEVTAPDGLTPAATQDVKISGGTYTLTPGSIYNSITVAGKGTLIIPGGEYHFTSDFNVSGPGQVIVDPTNGPVKIYTDGNIQFTGQSLTNSSDNPKAEDLQFYCSGKSEKVHYTGQSDAWFVLYAPETDVMISGQGTIFGTLVGKTLKVTGGGDIHYDTTLKDLKTPGGGEGVKQVTRIRL